MNDNITLTFTLELTVDVDGSNPGKEWIRKAIIEKLNESMPSVFIDSEAEDCILFCAGWEYK